MLHFSFRIIHQTYSIPTNPWLMLAVLCDFKTGPYCHFAAMQRSRKSTTAISAWVVFIKIKTNSKMNILCRLLHLQRSNVLHDQLVKIHLSTFPVATAKKEKEACYSLTQNSFHAGCFLWYHLFLFTHLFQRIQMCSSQNTAFPYFHHCSPSCPK